MTWVAFTDTDFVAWHDQVCAELGIPYPGANQETDATDPDAQWTTAYVNPWIDHVDADTLKADLPDADLERYGFKPCAPLVCPDIGDLFQPPEPPPWDWHQPVPDLEETT